MSNNQSLLFQSRRTRNQSIEAAIASISNLMTNIEKEGIHATTNTGMGKQVHNDKDRIKDDFSDLLPPNTMMTRQDTFGEGTGSTVIAKKHSVERLNLPNSPTNSVAKSCESNLNETFYSLDRNPSFDYETNAFVKEAKRISIKKSPKITMSPRKSFSCGNLRSHVQEVSTPTPETFDSFPNKMSNLPILNLARHTRESSFSISSPETVLTSYFSDTEDIETPESPIFHTHGESSFSFTPTLRQIRSGFLNEGPSRESVGAFKIKPLALSLPPKTKSEAIKKILQEKVKSTNEYNNNNHPSWRNTAMRYNHSEPNSEAERLIKNYFAETNLLRQHLYNEYNTNIQSRPHTDLQQVESDAEVLLDISTGGWGGRYSTGEKVPPLLYHESSNECFRQLSESTIGDDQTSTWRPKSPFSNQTHHNESTVSETSFQGNDRQAYPNLEIKTRKSNKQLPPAIPPKSPRRPQTMMKSASHSLNFNREESSAPKNVSDVHEILSDKNSSENLVKHRDFINERKLEVKASTHFTTSQPRILRSSKSENALDRYYKAGNDPLQQHERTSLTLSRLGFNSNKNFNGGSGKRGKFHNLYQSNHTECVGSDEDLGFSTNVTPSSQRSSRLIRSVAALKSLSKRITQRKSQMFDFSQQKIQTTNSVTNRSVSPRHPSDHRATESDPLPDSAHADIPKNRSLSPFQQVYARAWPVKKAPKSSMVVANKTQNYF